MATVVYGLSTPVQGGSGWNSDFNNDLDTIDSNLHTKLEVTLGETVVAYQPLYKSTANGKWYKAQAIKGKMPARALALEAGDADDEILAQRIGPVTNASWNWTKGKPVYLSDVTAGLLTHTWHDGQYGEVIGIPTAATQLLLYFMYTPEVATTSSTTTTTTTSTTTAAP